MTKKEKASQMQEMITRYSESGQSQKAFAADQGIKISKLRYWIRKQRGSTNELSGFVQIDGSSSKSIRLMFPNRIEFALHQHTPVNTLRALIDTIFMCTGDCKYIYNYFDAWGTFARIFYLFW